MKFKVGSKVIVKQVYSGGNFEVGDIVEICQVGDDDGYMTCYGAISPYDGIKWYLNEDEVEAVSEGDRIRGMTDEELAEYIAREKLNEDLNEDLKYSARLIYQLFKICDVSKEDAKKLFRPVKPGIGDYMGTGYYFLDCFNKIYSEYLYTCPEVLSRLIQYNIDLDKGENKK